MRISTQQIYDNSLTSIQQQAGDVMKYQTQINSGKKYQNASDNPQAIGYGLKLDFDRAQYDMYVINQKKMSERISNIDAQLISINSALAQVKQVVIESNGAFAQDSLSTTLYQKASSLRDSIKSFAQATDSSGQPILIQLDDETDTLGKVVIDMNIDLDEGVSFAESMGAYGTGNESPRLAVNNSIDILTLLDEIVEDLSNGVKPSSNQSENLDAAILQVRASQVKIGLMNAQVTNAQDSVELKKINADNSRSAILDTDFAESSANLAKSQALLQAAQSIFAKIQSSSLFDKI
jgi:flagellar hook-associated protein 3 FlgL